LSPKRIQIHHHDDNVQQVIGHLAVDDDLAIVHEMKAQVPVTAQGRVFTANLIDLRNQLGEAGGIIQIPVA